MKKRAFTDGQYSFRKGLLLVFCVLLLSGTQVGQLYAQPSPITTLDTQTYAVDSLSGYDYNFTAFGLYNGTYYNLYYPLNYSGNLPIIVQFGGYCTNGSSGLGNLVEDAPLCGYLACEGYAVLEFGYETCGSIPQASQTCLEVLQGTILPWVESSSFPLAIDKSKIGLCGHSAGASAVLGLASPDVDSSIALTPYYPSASLVPQVKNIAPTLILTGQNDTLVTYGADGVSYYGGLDAPKAILDITGGDHNLGVGTFDFHTAGTNATLKYVTAWFDATLKNNSTAASLFNSANLSSDSGVDIFQIDMATSNFDSALTYGLIIVAGVAVIVGFVFLQTKKRRRKALAPSIAEQVNSARL
jgi:hypothetical protein